MRPGPYASRLIGRACLVVMPMALLLAACGTPQPQVRREPAATDAAAPATVAVTPSPAPSVVTAAADPRACLDADCEVAVRPGDRLRLDRKGLDEIEVVALGPGGVRLRFEAGGGAYRVEGDNAGVSQECVNGRCHTDGALTLALGRPGRIGDIGLRLTSVSPDHAVLVLSPA
ncbi:hypothetical protein [Microbispora sp. H11081]|uniref:hypothetical protein n=1 Tax=Microbispora sp. H11081 TaxID=2729107 RepID=UPI00147356D4|nr:hypothetical protein [Microbispora sp. H11081]